jgi:hypothetical protein
MCVTACTPTTGGNSFLLTGAANTAIVGTGANNLCYYDFLAIAGGFNPVTGEAADRFCGGALSPVATTAAPGNTVCSKFFQFT